MYHRHFSLKLDVLALGFSSGEINRLADASIENAYENTWPHSLNMESTLSDQMSAILPVVLCGGAGTRLWPLSRKSLPKQFVPLVKGETLLDLTLARLKAISPHMMLVGAEEHRFLLKEALLDQGCRGDLVLEALAKNTAPAMAMAALLAKDSMGDHGLLLFCPADHHIADTQLFLKTIQSGIGQANQGCIVTFGVHPNYPSSAYGYIEQGSEIKTQVLSSSIGVQHSSDIPQLSVHEVTRFIEKPSLDEAQTLILIGNYLWNAGIFLTRVDTLLEALNAYAKEILDCARKACENHETETFHLNSFSMKNEPLGAVVRFIRPDPGALIHCPSVSIDYAVMEHHTNIAVIGFTGQWTDVGSWNAVAELTPPDQEQNRIEGEGIAFESHNTFIHAPHRTVVALGVEDLLIVDTPDALLVANRHKTQEVKALVDRLQQLNNPTALFHRKVARPWGWYDSVDQGERFQVKRICVKIGASLSLQKHHHRAEHWIVVKGTAEVTNGERVFLLKENESTFIPAGVIHRLYNPGQIDLEMIEVQSGSYLGEDDIVRIEDQYGRE